MTDCRIWVGCLHCYNDGRLTGEWFDVNTTSEEDVNLRTVHRVGKMTPMCEELWVMDHEGFDGLIESEGNVSEFYEAADLARKLDENNIDRAAWKAFAENEAISPLDLTVDLFMEAFRGEYTSGEDFAEEWYREVYGDTLDNLPDILNYNIDWTSVWRDLRLNGDFWTLEIGWQRVLIFDGTI